MDTVNSLRHDKASSDGFLPRGAPILQVSKSVKTVHIVIKRSREELKYERPKVEKVNKDEEINKVDKTSKIKNKKKRDKSRKKSKNIEQEKNMTDDINPIKLNDGKLGWSFDEENRKVFYFDTFPTEDIWRIRGVEELHKNNHELKLCEENNVEPCFVKLVRLELFKCKFCDLKYKSPVILRAHERQHSEKKFKCGKCDKSFTLKEYLDQHENKHITLKRFRCMICSKRFSYASGLSKHKKVSHKDLPNRYARLKLERQRKQAMNTDKTSPYRCEICGRTFTRGIAFANHKRGHNKNKIFRCFYCPQEFKLEYNLKQHIDKLHQDSTDDEDIMIPANENVFKKKKIGT